MGSRLMRLSAAALLAGAAAASVTPHLSNYVSSSAVVNAPLVTLRAPFDGVLAEGSHPFAAGVATGVPLLRLESQRQDRAPLAAVTAEVAAIGAEIAALDAQRGQVAALEAELRVRIAAYDTAIGDYLEVGGREAQAALDRAEAQRQQIEEELARATRLTASGTAARADFDSLRARHRMAEAEVAQAAAHRDALALSARSLGTGLAIDGTVDGGTYARQRLDEVTLRLAELAARRDTLAGRLAALESQAEALGQDLDRRTSFAPRAASAGVVWRAAPGVGTTIAAGETLMELLDCADRFVEVSLPGRLFERVRPGDPATILFKGAAAPFGAHVEAVGGAGARFDHPDLASDPPEVGAGDIQVLVRLDPVDPSDPRVAASFCDVGRTAEVRFARPGGDLGDRLAGMAGAIQGAALGWLPGATQVGGSVPADPDVDR